MISNTTPLILRDPYFGNWVCFDFVECLRIVHLKSKVDLSLSVEYVITVLVHNI